MYVYCFCCCSCQCRRTNQDGICQQQGTAWCSASYGTQSPNKVRRRCIHAVITAVCCTSCRWCIASAAMQASSAQCSSCVRDALPTCASMTVATARTSASQFAAPGCGCKHRARRVASTASAGSKLGQATPHSAPPAIWCVSPSLHVRLQ
jgi:hypothetical protein